MNVTFSCPACDRASRQHFDADTCELVCSHCEQKIVTPVQAIDEQGIHRCLVCPSTELYVRKNFSQRLGVTIIVVGLMASCVPWYYHWWLPTYAILFATALLDALFYMLTGNLLQCYRCHAEYRDMPGIDRHSAFDLETFERHRQQTARLAQTKSLSPAASEPHAASEPAGE